ncbi:MAG: polyribonucleotide nucleotidyltransferase [Myxococcota bacterium]|nr:polyribonucleotide nucleotidyltransferase [Myxococcota bacterium]
MLSKLELSIDNTSIRLETGRIARQANAAVVVEHRGSFILGTVTCNHGPSSADFLPLTVDYREKMASRGRIPGNFFRRETRAGENETLTSRLIDRSLRPLFPSGFNKETVVTVTVYSADESSDLTALSILAASTALCLSDVPFDGPVIGGTLQLKNGHAHLLPDQSIDSSHEFNLVVSYSPNGLVMMEGDSNQGTEAQLATLLRDAGKLLAPVFNQLERWRNEVGKTKVSFEKPEMPTDAVDHVGRVIRDALNDALDITDKKTRRFAFDQLASSALETITEYPADVISTIVDRQIKQAARHRILSGRRADGRDHKTVRHIECEVGLLAHNHGSALFTRGDTQALVSATLGSQREGQDMETLSGMVKRGFILHYNFPGFSVGETRRPSGPGRREIGHGSLARRALLGVMPTQDSWPYTTRIVSDITESNGSSSMATVCGGCLALLNAGVPLTAPVAGVAMGLVVENDSSIILTDILGEEDHLGDMDFKVAGTKKGITAVQLDNKLGSLPMDLLAKALEQARTARLHILDAMNPLIEQESGDKYNRQGRHQSLKIPVNKIGLVVGTGGKTIQGLQADTNTRIEVGKDGHVLILGQDVEAVSEAKRRIELMTADLRKDGVYIGSVSNQKEFGIFVRISEHEGLVHLSELRNSQTLESYKPGDKIMVRVLGADSRGRLKLSEKAAQNVNIQDATNYLP